MIMYSETMRAARNWMSEFNLVFREAQGPRVVKFYPVNSGDAHWPTVTRLVTRAGALR